MNSKEITTEIETMEENRARLQGELESAAAAHSSASEGLVSGGDNQTVEAVTAAHSRLAALREATAALEARLAEKREALAQALAKEKRQATLDRIAQIDKERDTLRLAYLAARERANQALRGPVEEMMTTWHKWDRLRDEADRLSRSIGDNVKAAYRFPVPQIEPFGVEVDVAFIKLGRLEERARRREQSLARQRREPERRAAAKAA